jgi:hypothetical protein
MKKRILLALALSALVALALPTVATANFAIHGNYVADTDACAGCHRAHTSVSTITWQDINTNSHSALLVSTATEMWQFCYACHDATSQGADTNVQQGLYEGTLYGTQGAVLNGGGFESVGVSQTTSTHVMNGASWGAYGGGYPGARVAGWDPTANGQSVGADIGESVPIKMDCATCHDPHGSSNYRILKAYVNGNYVGGYTPSADPTNPNPDGFVSSVETGWPDGGFRLHTAYPNYQPNYTTAMYAKGYNQPDTLNPSPAANVDKGMSGWCSGCHSTYLGAVATQTVGTKQYRSFASTYNAGDGFGLRLRHKHPMNVALDTYQAGDKASMVVTSTLPLAHDYGEKGQPWASTGDWIECLTCHRAHGTQATMVGWANQLSAVPGDQVPDFVSRTGTQDPSALLRLNNRGVCETCHNK